MKYNKELKVYVKPMLMTHGDIKKFTKGIPLGYDADTEELGPSHVG